MRETVRLVDFLHTSKMEDIEAAPAKLGKRLGVGVEVGERLRRHDLAKYGNAPAQRLRIFMQASRTVPET